MLKHHKKDFIIVYTSKGVTPLPSIHTGILKLFSASQVALVIKNPPANAADMYIAFYKFS